MRVLHLTTEFPPVIWGGLGTAVGGLAHAQARSGMTVGVLLVGDILQAGAAGYRPGQPAFDEPLIASLGRTAVTQKGITFFHASSATAVDTGLCVAATWRPDVIHLHGAWLWPVAHALRLKNRIPVVFTVHSLERAEYEHGAQAASWELQEAVIAAADQVVVISRSERELLAQYCPDAERRVSIVANGIDDTPQAIAAAARRREGTAPTILYCGRFVERKGIHELLEALPQVLAVAPGARAVLAGGYGSARDIERAWMPHGLLPYRDRVRFTGWLSPAEVADCYADADILVVPSWYEPFGMVVLEGMLHGLAIAAAAVGGPAEILEDGRTALLYSPRSVAPLTGVLVKLARDPELRAQLGAAAASDVRRRWLWPAAARQMRTVYQKAVRASHGSACAGTPHLAA